MYVSLFAVLWPRYQLMGAVFAYGVAWLISNTMLLLVGRLNSPFRFSVTWDYIVLAVLATACAFVTRWTTPGLASGLILWLAALGVFILLGRYRVEECRALLQCFLPLARFSQSPGASAFDA